MNRYLFLVASARDVASDSNTERLARIAATHLPADSAQTWLHLCGMRLEAFTDRRHGNGTYAYPTGDLARLLDAERPQAVVHAAVLGQADACERNPDLATLVNATLPRLLARSCRERGLRLGIVGVSLGGNVLLKWLGERGSQAPVVGAVADAKPQSSVPFWAEHLELIPRGIAEIHQRTC